MRTKCLQLGVDASRLCVGFTVENENFLLFLIMRVFFWLYILFWVNLKKKKKLYLHGNYIRYMFGIRLSLC